MGWLKSGSESMELSLDCVVSGLRRPDRGLKDSDPSLRSEMSCTFMVPGEGIP